MISDKSAKKSKKDIAKIVAFIIIIVAIAVLTVWLMPWIISLKEKQVRDALKEYVVSKGFFGVFILLGLQIMQVILAFIPGEIVEILSGLLYGTFGGYLICTIGMLIGTIVIFYTVKALGYPFINKTIGEGKLLKYKFLNDTKRLEIVTFIMFFIPGTPKDLLTYFMPFTKIKPMKFFLINTVARIPSIISSTYLGHTLIKGEWVKSLIVFVAIGIIGILGIIYNQKIVEYIKLKREKQKNKK
ncbi:MAG: VTT domain-containing protein [Oscillospiraceae bacterium]